MEAWLKQVKANEPQIYPTDDEVRQAVVSGRATVGLAASDEAAKAAASAAHVLLVYPNQKSIGTFVWPTRSPSPRPRRTARQRKSWPSASPTAASSSCSSLASPANLPLRKRHSRAARRPLPPRIWW